MIPSYFNDLGFDEPKKSEKNSINVVSTSIERKCVWKGYWMQGKTKGKMKCEFDFKPIQFTCGSTVNGLGKDEVGSFTWKGNLEGEDLIMTKSYIGKHSLLYEGKLTDEGGSWVMQGMWKQVDYPQNSGRFYLKLEVEKTKWKGHWIQGKSKGEMKVYFKFGMDGTVKGKGKDKVGKFDWKGTMKGYEIQMTKKYVGKHSLLYAGKFNEKFTKIVGNWKQVGNESNKGTFTLEKKKHD